MKTTFTLFLISICCLSCVSSADESETESVKISENGPKVVYKPAGMEHVVVKTDLEYQKHGDSSLVMDIYYPPKFSFETRIPGVVIVFGYTDEAQRKVMGKQFRATSWYKSWCRIMAASGFATITYETINPIADLEALEDFLQENAEDLAIDKNHVGLFAVSANTPVAISRLLSESNEFFRCGVFYYGFILTKDSEYLDHIDSLSMNMGFSTPRLNSDNSLNRHTPILIIRAGMDNVPFLNATISEFINVASKNNLPISFENYPTGIHGFDAFQDNDTTRNIIRNSLIFLDYNL